jgi:hypothetical protein
MKATAEILETMYPALPWRTPIKVTFPGKSGLACRLCIGINGLTFDNAQLFKSEADWQRHMEQAHGCD